MSEIIWTKILILVGLQVCVSNNWTKVGEFNLIDELFVDPQNKVVLGTKSTQVVEYDAHFHSWVIQVTTQKQLIPAMDIFSRQILTPSNMRNAPICHQYLTLTFSV